MDTADEGLAIHVDSLGTPHWIGLAATLVTAAIHLLLGLRMLPAPMGVAFVLAGAGFLGAIALVLLDYRRTTVYAVGIPYTLAQIVLWYQINFLGGPKSFPGDVGTLGAIDKVAQLVLLAVLVLLLR
jgi:hypothetical protein